MLWLSLHAVTSSIALNICKKIPQKIAKTHFLSKIVNYIHQNEIVVGLCIFDIFRILRLRDFHVDLQKKCANAERLLASLLSRGQEAKLEKFEKKSSNHTFSLHLRAFSREKSEL